MFQKPIRVIVAMRLYVACSGVIVSCVMLRLLGKPESEGYQMGFLLAVLSALALGDTIINDLFPRNVAAESVKRWRNIGFMCLGLMYACSIFFLLQYREPPWLFIIRLVLDSCACAYISFAGIVEVLEETQSKPPRVRKPMA